MDQEWNSFLAQQGASAEYLDFGNLSGELKEAQTGSIMTPLTDLGVIRATGADAADFLHNLLTNDIEALPIDGAGHYGFCTPKGRLLATFLIWRDKDDFLLALSADLHAAILKKLSMYVLRSKVKLTDASDELILIGVSGPQAAAALSAISPIPATLHTSSAEGRQIIRLGEQRFILAVNATAAPETWNKLREQLHPAGLSSWRWLEITAGTPQVTAATQEEFIPQMINYEIIGGVSFKKGCYPGQEIVARTHYLGKVKRRMYRAHIEMGMPAPGSPIFAPETGDQTCGVIVMAAPAPQGGHDVLVVIPTSCADTGLIHLGNRNGPMLQLLPLPYTV